MWPLSFNLCEDDHLEQLQLVDEQESHWWISFSSAGELSHLSPWTCHPSRWIFPTSKRLRSATPPVRRTEIYRRKRTQKIRKRRRRSRKVPRSSRHSGGWKQARWIPKQNILPPFWTMRFRSLSFGRSRSPPRSLSRYLVLMANPLGNPSQEKNIQNFFKKFEHGIFYFNII